VRLFGVSPESIYQNLGKHRRNPGVNRHLHYQVTQNTFGGLPGIQLQKFSVK
jgi:hypothetical protein